MLSKFGFGGAVLVDWGFGVGFISFTFVCVCFCGVTHIPFFQLLTLCF
ncbi:hypothetical protein HHE06_08950 [Helicobacter heilmannii]|nr:hypothetical protein HHE06_08950 [Helicobacter heilmannii]